MTVYDLSEQRRATLARVRASIVEMKNVEKSLPSDSPAKVLVGGIIRRLRSNEAKLASGMRKTN